MFYYLNGEIDEIGTNSVILNVGGIGFFLNTSLKTISELKRGQKARLYISESIGENNFDLYGFTDLQEKQFFEMLLNVSGVGPKAAVSLLSSMNTDTLIMAIINDDVKTLTAAPGIGRKIAQRIILELREKLGGEMAGMLPAASASATCKIVGAENTAMADAMAALTVLGYSSAEIAPVLRNGSWTGMNSEQIIREVLKKMI